MFRFIEIELHGWDLWLSCRIPLDADVVILSGPNGSGKTTMLDAIRQILNAQRLSQNRHLTHYLRRPNQPALVRAVVSNRPDRRGRRPFELQRVFTDEATLACALVPDGGTREKRFAVLPGRQTVPELQRQLLESRDWLAPERYRRVLQHAGVSRSLMHILALEQGRADELSRKGPRELFRWVMEARGVQQVLERYNAARARYQDSLKEVERQQQQLIRYQAELTRIERLVRRLEEYESWQLRTAEAEASLIGARLQSKLSESREIERKLPELRAKATNLTSTIERLGREIAALESALQRLEIGVKDARAEFEALTQNRDKLISERAVANSNLDKAQSQVRELESLPEGDAHFIHSQLDDARQRSFRMQQEIDSANSRLLELAEQMARLKQGIPVFPAAVQKTLAAFDAAGIRCSIAATLIEIQDARWTRAVESALGVLRFALCVSESDLERAVTVARDNAFPGPLVTATSSEATETGPIRSSGASPAWLAPWLKSIRFSEAETLKGTKGNIICINSTRQDEYGIWTSEVDSYVLGGAAVRAQLEHAEREDAEFQRQLAFLTDAQTKTRAAIGQLENELKIQNRRIELKGAANELPKLIARFDEAERALIATTESWKTANEARLAVERELNATSTQLVQKKKEAEDRHKELESTHSAVSAMELNITDLHQEIQTLIKQASDEMRVAADAGKLTISPEMAERDLKRVRDRMDEFMAEEPIPKLTVREEHKLVLHNIREMEQHVFARQNEADAARTELDQCRGEYLQVIAGTLHDYRRRAQALAGIARAKLEIEIPKLENTDQSIDEAGIVVRIGFDGKTPTEISDTAHSGGQQVIAGLILLMAMAETEGDSFFIIDEPFAHLSLDRVDEVGRFLRGSGSQFLITVRTTLDRGQLDPASLLVVLGKKAPANAFAPRPIVVRV